MRRALSPVTQKGSHAGQPSPLKGRRLPPEILTPEEVRRLLRACSHRAPTGVRNRALLVLLYRTGLRIGEALALYPKDVDSEAGTLRVLHGKGDRSRTVGMDSEAFAVLERWCQERAARGLTSRRPLLCTLGGTPLQPSYVRALLPRLARKAGIDKRVHPHGLRHAFAAECMAEGRPLNEIQLALGHANVATTSRYLQHIAPTQVIAMMRARQWTP